MLPTLLLVTLASRTVAAVEDLTPDAWQACAVEAGSGAAIPGATVVLGGGTEPLLRLVTDSSGCAGAAGPPSGSYTLTVVAPGAAPVVKTVRWPTAEKRFLFKVKLAQAAQEVTIEASREKPEERRWTITPEEARTLPGTNGDAIKVIQDLPGMARSAFNTGALLIQGSAPQDSEVFVDGQLIPQLYHFGGLTSVLNTEILSSIDYLPGGFGVRYGGAIGGVVDLSTKPGRDDHPSAILDANLIDSQLVGQGPLGEDASAGRLIGTVRRSYIDVEANAVIPPNAVAFSVFPRYYDYQLRYDAPAVPGGGVGHVLAYGSDDALGFLPRAPSGTLGAARGGFSYETRFHRLQFQWAQPIGSGWLLTLIPSVGDQEVGVDAGTSISLDDLTADGTLRAEASGRLAEGVLALLGLEGHLEEDQVHLNVIGGFEGGGSRVIQDNATFDTGKIGVYAQTDLDLGQKVHLIPGVRVDGFSPADQSSVDPRLALRLEPAEGWTGRAYAGLYHQPPTPQQWDKTLGNPDLRSPYAWQFGVGAGHRFDPATTVESDLFYKWMGDLVVMSPADAAIGQVRGSYTNDQVGRAYGWELLFKREMVGPFYGWLSYTLSRSERNDPYTPGGWYPFQYDQTHILTLLGGWRINRRWTLGARYRYTTGDPYTGVVGAVFDGNRGGYQPINGATNQDRLPSFQQLDLRVDDRFDRWGAHFDLYLDLENATNANNPEFQRYNYDYSQETYITGLPVIPSLGIRVEYP